MKIDADALVAAPDPLSIKDAAALLDLSPQSVYNYVYAGRLKTRGKKRPVTISKADLADFVGIDLVQAAREKARTAAPVRTQVELPAQAQEGIYVVFDDSGDPSSLWIGKPGQGKRYGLVEAF